MSDSIDLAIGTFSEDANKLKLLDAAAQARNYIVQLVSSLGSWCASAVRRSSTSQRACVHGSLVHKSYHYV